MPLVIRLTTAVFCVLAALLPAEARRVALVIGNADYKIGPLTNPVSDAEAVAEAFEKDLGFDKVILRKNLSFNGFRAALAEIGQEAAGAEVAAVFFAGHGTEHAGKNYLLPVDAKLAKASDLSLQAIQLDTVLEQLAGATRLKLVILDACRNNLFPMAGAKRGVSRGLSRIEPEDNTLVIYAAKDGTTADDGKGQPHSPFTAALLKHIATPGLEVSFVFRRVRDDVVAATKALQMPHTYGTLGGAELYLKPLPVVPPPPPTPSVPATTDKDVADLKAQVDALKAALAAKATAPPGPAVNEDVTKLKDQITGPQPQLKRPETEPSPKTVTAPSAPKTSTQRPPSDLTAYSLRFWPKGSLKIGQVVSQVTPYGRLVCQSTGPSTRPCRLEK
jgi:hypothetical protein